MKSSLPSASKRLRPIGRRARFVLVALVASLALAACGTSTPVTPASKAPPDVLPKGAVIATSTPPPASDTSCNATVSLPPPATMPTPGQMPKGSFMAQIQARGYLNVGVDQNTYLWGYRDPSTGQLSGFDIDMLRQVAAAIFGPNDPNDIHFTIVPNADRVQAVQKGLVDIVAETMTINCEREQSVDFSTVYYEAGQKILVPDNSTITGPQDLGGKRVCAANGSTSLQNLRVPGMPHMQLWGVNDETDCLVMLQQGQVDAISTDDAILIGLAAQDPNVKIVGSPFSSEPYGMAISKAHPDFTSFVNGVLAQVRADGTWAQIYDTYLMPFTHTPAPAPPVASYR
jgi:polar amino acid transport system substrate-binding protein